MDKQKLNITQLWHGFKQDMDQKAKEQLISHYAPLVKYVAGRLRINLPENVEFDDLVSYGTFGLLDAMDKFELDRGVKFETYASTRIRGAMIDGLRAVDWVPRSVRAKARQIEQQIHQLEHMYGRTPADHEVAVALDLSMDKYYSTLDDIRVTSLISLDEVVNPESCDEPLRMLDLVRDEQASVDESLLNQELLNALGEAIDSLPERERLVVSLYYHEGLTLKEIGYVLEVSESRVSQLHTKAILSLRSKLT